MQKSLNISIFLISFLLYSCGSGKIIAQENRENEYENALKYISEDADFTKNIKTFYPDLSDCDSIYFSLSNSVKPISTEDFSIAILNKTKLLNSIENVEDLSQAEQIEVFKSIYNFTEYDLEEDLFLESNAPCEIRLTFSKKINQLLPIKFRIIDKKIDPGINYKPRIGLYILEYNFKNEIIDSGHVIISFD